MEWTIGLDQGIDDARHFGGDGGACLAPEVCIDRGAGRVAAEFLAEGVLSHARGRQGGLPKRTPQTGVAALGQAFASTRGTRLVLGQIQPAELQELAMVREAAQIASFREDDERGNRTNTWYGAQQLIIRSSAEQILGLSFELCSSTAELKIALELQPKCSHSRRIIANRQCNAVGSQLVDLGNLGLLMHPTTHQRRDFLLESWEIHGPHCVRRREAKKKADEPLVALGTPEPLELWEVQREVMGYQNVLQPRFGPRNLVVGLGELLQIMRTCKHGIDEALRHAHLEQPQDYLSVLRIILVP